ncbi:hypothetical protein VMCG_05127 [Cytospora schulzeri]|uniref:Uncharacterized protein n=1 Tax=Cytospora schulzeri TaxID=448051 RepID=A0A423WQZ2_9PEZI|nr:hypothetical protein VMCG_05127 [Valsa malicola]
MLIVFQEVYETLLYLFTPFILPISFAIAPAFCGYLLAGTSALYLANVVVFNESLYKYARYFAKQYLKVIEDKKAVGVVLRLEETTPVAAAAINTIYEDAEQYGGGAGSSARPVSVAILRTRGSSRISNRRSARFSYISANSSELDVVGGGSAAGRRRSFIPGSVDIISLDIPESPTVPASPGRASPPAPGYCRSYNSLSHGRKASYGQFPVLSAAPGARSPYGRPSSGLGYVSTYSIYSSLGYDLDGEGGYTVQSLQLAYIPADIMDEFGEDLDEKAERRSICLLPYTLQSVDTAAPNFDALEATGCVEVA